MKYSPRELLSQFNDEWTHIGEFKNNLLHGKIISVRALNKPSNRSGSYYFRPQKIYRFHGTYSKGKKVEGIEHFQFGHRVFEFFSKWREQCVSNYYYSTYEGTFRQDKRYGKGTLSQTFRNMEKEKTYIIKYTGDFYEGKMHGKGKKEIILFIK